MTRGRLDLMDATATRLDRRLRARDLDDLPHEWDTRYELIGGVLHMSKRPSFEHQDFLSRLLVRIAPAVFEIGGRVVQEDTFPAREQRDRETIRGGEPLLAPRVGCPSETQERLRGGQRRWTGR